MRGSIRLKKEVFLCRRSCVPPIMAVWRLLSISSIEEQILRSTAVSPSVPLNITLGRIITNILQPSCVVQKTSYGERARIHQSTTKATPLISPEVSMMLWRNMAQLFIRLRRAFCATRRDVYPPDLRG